jgi:hypothetical protein
MEAHIGAHSHAPRDEARLRRAAGALVHAYLANRRLPDYLPGEPSRLAAAIVAWEDAPELLATVAELFGVKRWTREEFLRVFIEGALAGWQPGLVVHESSGGVRILAPTCPVSADVERDPRVCQACQALHEQAARVALPGRVASVDFNQLIADGDAACEVNIRWKEK